MCAGSSGTTATAAGRHGLPRSRTTSALTSRPSAARIRERRAGIGAHHAEHDDHLALELVGHADRGRLDDRRMGDDGRLDLGRADPLAGDLERVVGAAVEVPEAVAVEDRPVAVDPGARQAAPVRVEVALAVAGVRPRSRGSCPATGARMTSSPTSSTTDPAGLVDHVGRHPGHGPLNEVARIGRSTLQPTMPPDTSVPPE